MTGGATDTRTTVHGYGAVVGGDTSGWTLFKATTSTVQLGSTPSSADLTTVTRYNASGQVLQKRLPADQASGTPGATAGTTNDTYYTTGSPGGCVHNDEAGLLCTSLPPSGVTTTPGTTYNTYDSFGNVLTQTESNGSSSRLTTTTYDGIERKLTTTITGSGTAPGQALDETFYAYDDGMASPHTGTGKLDSVITKNTGGTQTGSLTTVFDALGRIHTYTDTSSTVSTYGYDIDGRTISLADGKGTTIYTYDGSGSGEHRGVITSEDVASGAGVLSTFTATYDANGNKVTETYPNGLIASTGYDNDANSTALTYAKSGSTWLAFTATRGGAGRIVAQTSNASSQTFGYDYAGRLASAYDTLTGTGCTSRVYAFDRDSNRTTLASYPPATGGACSLTTTPTSSTSTYNSADQLNAGTGYVYDGLGRSTTVPSTDAVSYGTYNGVSGAATIGYYVNDLVYTESQTTPATTLTYALDPNQNRVFTETNATTSTTTTSHYSDDTDSPSWISTSGTSWQRNLLGPDGTMVGTIDQAGTVLLDLVNMQGSIIATAPDTSGATAITSGSYSETTEYGAPRTTSEPLTTTTNNYGWLGDKRRSDDSLAGLTLMGVRLYNPATGRFLSTDPIPGGNPNPYVYPLDPINGSDLTGNCWGCSWVKHHWKAAVHLAVTAAVVSVTVVGVAAVCSTGVGCFVLAGVLGASYGMAANVAAAKAMHERVKGGQVANWMASGAAGGLRNLAFLRKFGKQPAGYAWQQARRMF